MISPFTFRNRRSCPYDLIENFVDEICNLESQLTSREIESFQIIFATLVTNLEEYILDYWGMEKYLRIRNLTSDMMHFPVR